MGNVPRGYTYINVCMLCLAQVHLTHQVFESSVSSDVCLMKKILTQLKKKDAADIFADPVPLEDVSLHAYFHIYLCTLYVRT